MPTASLAQWPADAYPNTLDPKNDDEAPRFAYETNKLLINTPRQLLIIYFSSIATKMADNPPPHVMSSIKCLQCIKSAF